MSDLDTLFPAPAFITIRDHKYELRKITVAQMSAANLLAKNAFAAMDFAGGDDLTELNAASHSLDAIIALMDGGHLQATLDKLLVDLVGVTPELVATMTVNEIVDVVVSVVRHNSDFFALRLPATLRSQLQNLAYR